MLDHQSAPRLPNDPHAAALPASTDTTPNASGAPTSPVRLPWIPIRSLAPRHRPRILQHLLALDSHDRYLRFGYPADDIHVGRYVDSLDFERDEIFGVFNRRLEVVALAHLAYPPAGQKGPYPRAAEFGGSVRKHLRGRGYGARLFEHAVLHARNRGLETFFIHALSENRPMLRIAKQAGATVERDGPESDAYLKLPPDTLASRLEQAISNGAAAIDYRLKQQANMVGSVMGAFHDVRTGLLERTGTHRE